MSDLVSTLRDEARFRPTIWGDACPLLIAAADEIERLRARVAEVEARAAAMKERGQGFTKIDWSGFGEIDWIDWSDNPVSKKCQPL